MTTTKERTASADQREATADQRDTAADSRDAGATDREHSTSSALVWLFAVLAIIGLVLVIVLGQVMRRLDDATDVDARQARATEELVIVTQKVSDAVDASNAALEIGRYERVKFQIDQRRLVCLDLQDGDTGATDEQIAECAKDYIKLPPKPEGYTG